MQGILFFHGSLAALVAAFLLDATVANAVHAHCGPALVHAAGLVSRYASWPFLMLACLPFLAFAWRQRRRHLPSATRPVLLAMLAATIAGLSADAVRGLTGRTRPAAPVSQGWFGPRHAGRWIVGDWNYNAFPSGHTATVTALVAVVGLSRRRLIPALAWLPLLVAASRVCTGAHHLSDVTAGALLGVWIAAALHRRLVPDKQKAG